jgi:lysozyme
MRITAERAEELLRADVARFEQVVRQQVKVPLTQGQFDALVSFVFNVGAGAFRRSTLLRRLNARDYMGAAMQFERWVQGRHRAHGERLTLPGLVRRRRAEARMFIAG